MRGSLVLLTVLGLAGLAGRGEAAPSFGTPLNSGDRAAGTIDSTSDRDLFRVEIPDGARLGVVVKAAKKSALLPDLELRDPSGVPVDLKRIVTGLTTGTVAIPVLGIQETGAWTVAVSGHAGTTGDYQVSVKVSSDTKVKATITVPAGATVQQHFVAVKGARVDFAILEREGPALGSAGLCCPHDHQLPGTGAVRAGNRLVGKKIVLDHADAGLYGLEMTNSASGPTTVEVSVVVRFPKVKTRKISLGEEPRPATMSPTTGLNGTSFVLTGTNFQDGARVVFGDSDEAVDVQWISATEIRGKAPECAASREGEAVAVSVLNPDGQYGSSPMMFAFVGIPGPTSFTPNLSPLEGGTTVTVAGVRFRPGYTVDVGGIPCSSVTILSASNLTFLTPPALAGAYSVVVRDEFGRAAAALPGLWYSDAPDVSSADPSEMSSLGGVTVHLAGSGFVPGVRVFVGGREGAILEQDPPASLSFRCPPAEAGTVELEVRDPLGRSFKGDLLTMTRALHDTSATALPAAPTGADFRGDIVNLGDTNGDGLPEILVTAHEPWINPQNGLPMPGSFLLVNLGGGRFSDETANALPNFNLPGDDGQGSAAVMGDLDGDDRADAALVRADVLPSGIPFAMYGNYKGYYDISFPTTTDPPTASAMRILLNDGTGRMADGTDTLAPKKESTPAYGKGERWQGSAAALGDLDGDGDSDLLLVAGDGVDVGTVSGVQWTYRYRYYWGYKYTYKDKAILGQKVVPSIAMRVLDNDGSGAFKHDSDDDPAPVLTGSGGILDDFRGAAVALGDLDGDGRADAVVVGTDRTKADNGSGGVKDAPALRVLLNDGKGAFAFSAGSIPDAPGATIPESDEWWQGCTVALADLDGDGDLDIVVGRDRVHTWVDAVNLKRNLLPALRIFRNEGDASFKEDTAGFLHEDLTTRPTAVSLLAAKALVPADMDGDGDIDLAITGRATMPGETAIPGTSRMATRILLNEGKSGFVDATAAWLGTADLLPADGLTVGDLDGDGVEDLVLVFNGDPGGGRRSLRLLISR